MFTKPFSKLSKKDADIAGGKGASLGEMLNAGIPVPDGFVVLSTTFDEFLHKADLIQEIDAILESVDHKAVHSIDAASEKIQELIKHAEMPTDIASEIESQFKILDSEFVAVRSSATAEDGADHAWAGQLESYLNTTQVTLLEKVQHCWASLFTPRAIFYRFEKGLHTTKISVAVVVQKMVNSEKSGIAFSVHPVTEDRNQIIIEAGFGLGEAIVSGSVTPDSYVIEKEPRKIIDINVSNQTRAMYRKVGGGNEWQDIGEKGGTQVFAESEILDLANIIMTIENHYGFPCDIEWAYESAKFYIVQSRPITTLSEEKEENKDINKKPYYYKAYTRDTCLTLQKAWILAVSKLYETLKGNRYPYPPIIMYLFDGTIEIYDNEEFDKELSVALLSKNQEDNNFFNSYVDPLLVEAPFFEELWIKGKVESADELKDVLNRWNKFVEKYVVYYLSQYDTASPAFILEKGHKIRETDEFFARTDKMLRQSIQFLYPELIGVENSILQEEIANPPTKQELQKRQTGFVFTGDDNHVQALRDLPYSFESLADKTNSVKGQVGFKGKVQGKVFILKRNSDVDMVQEGDIIVSPMTTPEHVPAMKKAIAFVTDEGGITCHAAIIAREMKKPCVIGTKHATEIFKNGDIVEVDADNGIVTILKSNKTAWEKVLQRNFPPLAWTAGGYYEFHGLNVGPMTWIREREMQVKYNTVQSYMIQDPNAFYTSNINELIQEIHPEFEKAIDEDNQKVMKIVEMLPGNTLPDLYELGEKHKLAYGLMLIGFDVAIDIRNQIDKIIKNKDEGFETYLATPWKPTAIQREQFAATQAKIDIEKNPENKNNILQKLANDFGYIHQDYLGQPWTALDYEKSFDDNITLQSGMDESYDLSKLSEYEAWLVTIFKKMTYMYEEGRNAMVRTVWAMKETSKQIGLNPETLLYMTAGEVEQYSLGKMEAISDELVAIRKKYFAVHFDNGIYSEYSGEAEVKSLIKREKIEFIWRETNEAVDTLKGSIAFKGYAKGRVRLVFTQDDANQVQEGEILVSPMTQVEFLSGIRKCAAIITDEGGIICHAAIVSREFSKPCILAIGKATKVLKNGDMVEVDANTGIIRIL